MYITYNLKIWVLPWTRACSSAGTWLLQASSSQDSCIQCINSFLRMASRNLKIFFATSWKRKKTIPYFFRDCYCLIMITHSKQFDWISIPDFSSNDSTSLLGVWGAQARMARGRQRKWGESCQTISNLAFISHWLRCEKRPYQHFTSIVPFFLL